MTEIFYCTKQTNTKTEKKIIHTSKIALNIAVTAQWGVNTFEALFSNRTLPASNRIHILSIMGKDKSSSSKKSWRMIR